MHGQPLMIMKTGDKSNFAFIKRGKGGRGGVVLKSKIKTKF